MPATGEGLSECSVLFPSRRARLFFIDALSQIAGRPMWQPTWATIDSLMEEISGLRPGDRVRLITELYKIYSQYHAETVRPVLLLGRHASDGLRHDRQIRRECRPAFSQHHGHQGVGGRYFVPHAASAADREGPSGRRWATSPTFRPRSGGSWRSGRAWDRSTIGCGERLSELGIAYNGMIQRAAAPTGCGRAATRFRSRGVTSWRASTPCRSARSSFSAFCRRLPRPISTGITTPITGMPPNRRRGCSCARIPCSSRRGATDISPRQHGPGEGADGRGLRFRMPCSARLRRGSCANWRLRARSTSARPWC